MSEANTISQGECATACETSEASKISQEQRATSHEAAKNLPPFLRLPVELRNILYDYVTSQHDWLPSDPKQAEKLIMHSKFVLCAGRQSREKPLVQRQRAFLTSTNTDADEPFLTCAFPLSRVNKQIRAEFSVFLRTAPMSVTTRVRNFDFRHVWQFLCSLEQVHQDAFKVRLNGTAARTLTMELQSPYTVSCMDGLQLWVEQVHSFVGPGKRAELSAFYSTAPAPRFNHVIQPVLPLPDRIKRYWKWIEEHTSDGADARAENLMLTLGERVYLENNMYALDHAKIDRNNDLSRRVPVPVMMDTQEHYEQCPPGAGKLEAHKIMMNLYMRFRADCYIDTPKYDDILEAVASKLWLG